MRVSRLFCALCVFCSLLQGQVEVSGSLQVTNVGEQVIDAVQVTYETSTGPVQAGYPGPLGLLPAASLELAPPRGRQVLSMTVDAAVSRDGAVFGDPGATLVRRLRGAAEAKRLILAADPEALRHWQSRREVLSGADTDWKEVFFTRFAKRVPAIDLQTGADKGQATRQIEAAPEPLLVLGMSCAPNPVEETFYFACTINTNRALKKNEKIYLASTDPTVAQPTIPWVQNLVTFSVQTFPIVGPPFVTSVMVLISATGPNNTVSVAETIVRGAAGRLTNVLFNYSPQGSPFSCPNNGWYQGPPVEGEWCRATVTLPFFNIDINSSGSCSSGSANGLIFLDPRTWNGCDEEMTGVVVAGVLSLKRGIYSRSELAQTGVFSASADAFWDCNLPPYIEPEFIFACGPLTDGAGQKN